MAGAGREFAYGLPRVGRVADADRASGEGGYLCSVEVPAWEFGFGMLCKLRVFARVLNFSYLCNRYLTGRLGGMVSVTVSAR